MSTSTAPSSVKTSVSMMHHGQFKLDLGQVLDTKDKHLALSKGIRYLTSLSPSDLQELDESDLQKLRLSDIERYLNVSSQIMERLDALFQGSDNSYLPWVKYFDACNKFKIAGGYSDENLETFIKGISQLTMRLLLKVRKDIDWRISKQMLALQRLFEPSLIALVKPEQLVEAFLREIEQGLKGLVWKEQNQTTLLSKHALHTLQDAILTLKDDKKVLNAVISGRFDKADFAGLEHTLILGEDGGLFLLLNTVNKEEKKILEQAVSSDYLKDKVSGVKQTTLKEQIVIGKGGFGKVRFAVSLFAARAKPGDVTCIKKTGSFAKLNADMKARQEIGYNVAEQVLDATLGDYFTGDIAKAVYSPAIVDMALVMSKDFIKKPAHQKGYLMMEILPQNTGIKIFKDPQYQKWEYQKPYMIDVMEGVNELLAKKVAMTDLKPENTLYNTDTRKATIIDLGGAIEVADLAKFDTASPFQSTVGYQAPELLKQGTIDIGKALAYSCGKILEKITNSEGFTTDHDIKDIKLMVRQLTEKDPSNRLSINKALIEIRKMGDNAYQQQAIFSHYISKVKHILATNKASLSINDDIEETDKLYLNQEVTRLDPYKYRDLEREDLFDKINTFFARRVRRTGQEGQEGQEEHKDKQVLLLLGAAGSGKSIALQLKFIKAVDNWQSGKPLPVYFNLANGIDLNTILTSLNQLFGTNVTLKTLYNQDVDLYVDSFDEGIGTQHLKDRDDLINNYIKQLSTQQEAEQQAQNSDEESRRRKIKVLVSCRTDFLQNDSDELWFAPKSADETVERPRTDLLDKCYIAPISYKTDEELRVKINKYLDYRKAQKTDAEKASETKYDAEWYTQKIQNAGLKNIIDTGFMFYMVMQTLPDIDSHIITKQEIYKTHVTNHQTRLLKMNPWTEEQRQEIAKSFPHYDEKNFFDQLAQYIASELHIRHQFKLDHNNFKLFFQGLGYSNNLLFRHQMIYHLLKVLPLKIEIKSHDSSTNNDDEYEEIIIGFAHDTIKNYYLVRAMQQELEQTGESKLLASRNFVKDKQLLLFLFQAVESAPNSNIWEEPLLQAVLRTKTDKSLPAITCAANAITVLNLLQHVLPGQDLTNISIRGASLRNGWLRDMDFRGADLTGADLTNAKLTNSNLAGANLSDVNLNIYPDLDHFGKMEFSPNGHLALHHDRGEYWGVRILDLATSKELLRVPECAELVTFSPNGRIAVTKGSQYSGELTIWDVTTAQQLKTLDGRMLRYSSNGQTLAIISSDRKLVNIFSSDYQLLTTLRCDEQFQSVSYSPDGKTIATGTCAYANIWDVATGKLLNTFTDNKAQTVIYSPDGKTIVTWHGGVMSAWNIVSSQKILQAKAEFSIPGYRTSYEFCNVIYSPDGKTIATAFPKRVEFWDTTTGKLGIVLGFPDLEIVRMCYSPNGKTVAVAFEDKTIKIWDTTIGRQLGADLTGHSRSIISMSYSPDGKILASGDGEGKVKIWNVSSDELEGVRNAHSRSVIGASYSPDGRTVATASLDSTIKFWDAATGRQIRADLDLKESYGGEIFAFCYSPDGKAIAIRSVKKLSIWDAATHKLIGNHMDLPCNVQYKKEEEESVRSISYSPDGNTIATGLKDGAIMIWDVATQRQLGADLKGHTSAVLDVKFSLDGKILASASRDNAVILWDVVTQKQFGWKLKEHGNYVNSISFSPDGKTLVSGSMDFTLKLWDVVDQKQLVDKFGKHSSWVMSVSFSPDGKTVVSGSMDNTLKLWDVVTQKQLGDDFNGHSGQVCSVSFSPDGKTILSASHDKSVKIWAERNGKWRVIHDLSASEVALNVEKVIIESAVLSEENKKVFEQRKCQQNQKTILPAKQDILREERETQELQQFTKGLEVELFAKFTQGGNKIANEFSFNPNHQSQTTNLVKLDIPIDQYPSPSVKPSEIAPHQNKISPLKVQEEKSMLDRATKQDPSEHSPPQESDKNMSSCCNIF